MSQFPAEPLRRKCTHWPNSITACNFLAVKYTDHTWFLEDAACRLLGIIAQGVSSQQVPAAVNIELDLSMVYLHPVQAAPIPHDLPQGLAAQRAALEWLPLCLLQASLSLWQGY